MTQAFQDNYDVQVLHAWGMTEMSPLGTLGSMKPEYAHLTGEEKLDIQVKQGHAPFGVDLEDTRPDVPHRIGLSGAYQRVGVPHLSGQLGGMQQALGQGGSAGNLVDLMVRMRSV